MNEIRVVVSGYGVIGRRIADAIAPQDDLELTGITDVEGDYGLRNEQSCGVPV